MATSTRDCRAGWSTLTSSCATLVGIIQAGHVTSVRPTMSINTCNMLQQLVSFVTTGISSAGCFMLFPSGYPLVFSTHTHPGHHPHQCPNHPKIGTAAALHQFSVESLIINFFMCWRGTVKIMRKLHSSMPESSHHNHSSMPCCLVCYTMLYHFATSSCSDCARNFHSNWMQLVRPRKIATIDLTRFLDSKTVAETW